MSLIPNNELRNRSDYPDPGSSERTFEHFPANAECPLCSTNDDKKCCLVPIDWTDKDGHCEAQPMHVDCVKRINLFRYNKEIGLFYRKT